MGCGERRTRARCIEEGARSARQGGREVVLDCPFSRNGVSWEEPTIYDGATGKGGVILSETLPSAHKVLAYQNLKSPKNQVLFVKLKSVTQPPNSSIPFVVPS
jgi:hypothetical protein